jgi:hypothetical protein
MVYDYADLVMQAEEVCSESQLDRFLISLDEADLSHDEYERLKRIAIRSLEQDN